MTERGIPPPVRKGGTSRELPPEILRGAHEIAEKLAPLLKALEAY